MTLTTEVNIEKDIPVPTPSHLSKWKDIARKMESGDSILFPKRSIGSALMYQLKKLKVKTVSRKVENGIRVWKI